MSELRLGAQIGSFETKEKAVEAARAHAGNEAIVQVGDRFEVRTLEADSAAAKQELAKAVQSDTVVLKDTMTGQGLATPCVAFVLDTAQQQGKMVTVKSEVPKPIVAAVDTAEDPRPTQSGVELNLESHLTSWKDFPAFLNKLRQIQQANPGRPVVLDLNVHGNEGTGFKLLSKDGNQLNASVASAAWINEQIRKAGFKPEEIMVVSEACNGGHSYTSTVDGMNQQELADVREKFAHGSSEGQDGAAVTPGKLEVFDVKSPGEAGAADQPVDEKNHNATVKRDDGIRWYGRASGSNIGGIVLSQMLLGQEVTGKANPAASNGEGGPSAEVGLLNGMKPAQTPVVGRPGMAKLSGMQLNVMVQGLARPGFCSVDRLRRPNAPEGTPKIVGPEAACGTVSWESGKVVATP